MKNISRLDERLWRDKNHSGICSVCIGVTENWEKILTIVIYMKFHGRIRRAKVVRNRFISPYVGHCKMALNLLIFIATAGGHSARSFLYTVFCIWYWKLRVWRCVDWLHLDFNLWDNSIGSAMYFFIIFITQLSKFEKT